MLIAQISDFHVTVPGGLAYGRVDTNAALTHAVHIINALRPLPDLVVGTGDHSQTGSDDEYAAVDDILSGLQMPFAPVLGNHDHRETFRHRLAGSLMSSEQTHFIQYALDMGGLRLLVLDTVSEGSDDPFFCEERLAWLAVNLPSDRPTIIAMHHPPFPSGIDWLDPANTSWSAAIGDLVEKSPNQVRIICGHVHRCIHRIWRGVPVSTAPSVAHQVAFDLTSESPPMLSFEAPGFQVHRWDGADFTTYAVSIDGFSHRFSPTGDGAVD